MIVKLNNETCRIQFIKEVEKRKHGKTTIKTICRIFRHSHTTIVDGKNKHVWEEVCNGSSRQSPVDKYDHLIGKRVAMRDAMIKEIIYSEPEPEVFVSVNDFFGQLEDENEPIEILYHFDRVDRSYLAQKLEAEFDRSE